MPALGLALGLPFTRPSGSSFAGPLDAYTSNLSVALSVDRRLLSSYEGPLFRVRADRVGQPEEDIGFLANGDVDTASLQSFVGSDDAYVTTVYRQDGSASDLIQASASLQPRIAMAGVVDDGMAFQAGQYLDIASAAQSIYTDGTNVQVLMDCKPDAAGGRVFDFGPDLLSAWFPLSGIVYLDLPFPAGRVSASTPSGLTGADHICSIEREDTTVRLRTDGSVDITGAVSGSISGTSIFRIGTAVGGSGAWTGLLRSFIVWKDCANPATRAALLT